MKMTITRTTGEVEEYSLNATTRLARWLAEEAASSGVMTLFCHDGKTVSIPWHTIHNIESESDENDKNSSGYEDRIT